MPPDTVTRSTASSDPTAARRAARGSLAAGRPAPASRFVRIVTGANDITSAGTLARHHQPGHTDRTAPVSAACGRNVRAWSTSASRA